MTPEKLLAARAVVIIVSLIAFLNDGGDGKIAPSVAGWPTYRHDLDNSGFVPASGRDAPYLKREWVYRADSRITGSPTIGGGLIFLGTWNGDVLALDAHRGSLRWKVHLGANSDEVYGGPRGVTGSIALSNGIAYAASGNCTLTALRVADGRRLWQTKVCNTERNDDVYASPVVSSGLVLIGVDLLADRPTDRGREVGLNAASGKIRWTLEPARYVGNGAGISASPVVDVQRRIAFVGTGNPLPRYNPPPGDDPGSDSIIAIDLRSGKTIWTFGPVHPHDANDEDFLASPNRINIGSLVHPHWIIGEGSKDGSYYAIDAASGASLWRRQIPGGSPSASILGTAATASGAIFVSLYDGAGGSLTGMRALDGVVLWQQQTGGEYEAPVVWGSAVFTTETTGKLKEFAESTGRPLGAWDICTPATGRGPSVAGNVLYAASGNCLTAFISN